MPLPTLNMTAEHYWIGTAQLEEGSRVRPGSWGRIVRLYGVHHPAAYREAIWELARLEVAPEAPSRLECSFLFQGQAAAEHLRAQRPLDLIYRVRIIDAEAPTCVTDMQLVDDFNTLQPGAGELPIPGQPRMGKELETAHNYWRGVESGTPKPEVLTSSILEIVAALD